VTSQFALHDHILITVLRGRFPEGPYYKHFFSLVRILNLCLQFKISEEDIVEIELGIRKWAVDYAL
jgi:hypothetical protein